MIMDRYRNFIKSFLKKGYKPIFFEKDIPKNNALIIRHDVDFDINLAPFHPLHFLIKYIFIMLVSSIFHLIK